MEEGVAALASLTHVCIWAEHGWTHITAEEAAQRFPSGTICYEVWRRGTLFPDSGWGWNHKLGVSSIKNGHKFWK